MRHAWLILALAGLALVACNPTPAVETDGGTITPHDSGAMAVDSPGHDAFVVVPVDANVPPYDGGMATACTGLTPVDPAHYCMAYADTYVSLYRRCGLIGDNGATELHAAVLAGCDTTRIEASVTAGHATWDAANAACCLARSANDTSCFFNVGAGGDECNFVQGTVANGMPCANGTECMNGYCHITDSCMGICTAYATTGTACGMGDVTCAPDADCDTNTRRCTTVTGAPGTACSAATNTQCEANVACVDPDGDGAGTCTALPTRGQACTQDTILCDLNSSVCQYDFASSSGVCVPAFAIGSHCIVDAQCVGDAYCAGANFGAMTYGTCTARAHRGGSCTTDKCVDGLVCLPDHTCGDAPAQGAACTPTSGCATGTCGSGGTCVPLHAAGDHCTANTQCASGICNPGSLVCAPSC